MSEHYQVNDQDQGKRIDKLMTEVEPSASRTQVQSWIKDGLVKVDGSSVKSNYKIQGNEKVEWVIPEPEVLDVKAENIPIDIVYEDKDVIVVNKQRGMVVHPSAGHPAGTLVNALLHHCDDLSGINGAYRPGIVHRIDKDTSGLLMVAKNDHAHQSLAGQLAEKTIDRKYEAIVHGEIQHEYGTIEAPIGRDPKDRQSRAVVENGKPAVTHFKVLKLYKDFTHVECVLETGRTHQIRVHMKYINHPLAGDPKYGPRKSLPIDGQALHARTLGFIHPVTGEKMEFSVEPPGDFIEMLEFLQKRR
ncbi:RluA family pseudouridine synthase [Thalassobacillus pellis]|uniref:RluA family pseudouridine synthase n=1 Tax=Thalassobacillus pellis TaxID=748008 RepID=UPI0019609255|nr:23S rRNA pseudouridine1911/1915/1917 synthase [Thalassobacillus pellis]